MFKQLMIWSVLLISFFFLVFKPTWKEVQYRSNKGCSDFATYYYAVKVAQNESNSIHLALEPQVSKNGVINQLNRLRYRQQSVVFLNRDALSFQTLARIKSNLSAKGLIASLDSSKRSIEIKRKSARKNKSLFTVSTHSVSNAEFEIHSHSKLEKIVSADKIEQELLSFFEQKTGTYLSSGTQILVRPFGQKESPSLLTFESNRLKSIHDTEGAVVESLSLPFALEYTISPYDSRALSIAAKNDHTWNDKNNNNVIDATELKPHRRSVHPFLYPPPALLFMSWVGYFSLVEAYILFHALSWLALLGCFWIFRRWLNTPFFAMALLAIVFNPISNSIEMGQINLVVLLALVYSLANHSGLILSIAGMIKMSPALLVVPFTLFGKLSYPLYAFLGAICLSLLSLPWLSFQDQFDFYRVLLPQFSTGEYLGLKIKIDMFGNHSIPNLFYQIWPGDSKFILSSEAKRASSLALMLSFLAMSAWTYRCRHKGRFSLEALCGAFVVLLVLTPVYAYEHHLVFLLVPILILYRHFRAQPSPFFVKLLYLLSVGVLSFPLHKLSLLSKNATYLPWLYQEAKMMAALALLGLCLWAANRCQSAIKAA